MTLGGIALCMWHVSIDHMKRGATLYTYTRFVKQPMSIYEMTGVCAEISICAANDIADCKQHTIQTHIVHRSLLVRPINGFLSPGDFLYTQKIHLLIPTKSLLSK